ncbi:hypothetical protein TELCIR_05126 [Teladorsagia circumcincta]|uniref:Kinesin-like domain-containing protein n=1 Tax=Teladorsagia circumcincta TaxID=45464 RepID=A0A2G9URM7_TELCI|nr:hypothetical protein TELCIR_05126 [Teladorsagia circumcincta]
MRRHARLSVVEERGRSRLYIEPLSTEGRISLSENSEDVHFVERFITAPAGAPFLRDTLHNYICQKNQMLHLKRIQIREHLDDVDMSQSVMDESVLFDYNDAWHEVNGDGSGNPISTAVDQYMEQVTLKHQEDKQAALERQYEAFERYIQNLTAGGFTPSTPMTPGYGFGTPLGTPGTALPPFPFPANPKQMVRSKFFYWAQRKEEMFAESLKRLKSDVIRANALTREANMISRELGNSRRQTTYDVTLQIPAANLRPSKIKEHHNLIGVANVFLEVLFHDMKLDYQVGSDYFTSGVPSESDGIQSPDREFTEGLERAEGLLGKVITCRVRIKKASSLPESLSHFVFCQYSFFNLSEMLVVAPVFDPTEASETQTQATTFVFDHEKDFKIVVTEEFLEYVQDDALSIEVWGHRNGGALEMGEPRLDAEEKNKSLQVGKWVRLELWTEFRELSETGQWVPVEVRQQEDVATGGVHQLKQEEDLERIRAQWTLALQSRQKYLEQQLDSLCSKTAKSEAELEREHSLMGQWISLTEERTAVSIPAPNSDIPGAPCDWIPPPGVEEHVPVLFLDLNSDDMTGEMTSDENTPRIAGLHSFLPKEESGGPLIMLPIVHFDDKEVP